MATVTTLQKASFTVGFLAAAVAGVIVGCSSQQWRWAVPQKAASAFPALEHTPFGPGEKLDYDFGWNGIPAATLTVSLSSAARDGRDCLVFGYKGQTTGSLSHLYTFEASGETCLDPLTLQPLSADMLTRTRNKEKQIVTRFDWQRALADAKVHRVRRGKVSEKEVSLEVGLDTASALLLMRATDVPARSTRTLRVVSAEDAYEVTITPVGPEEIAVPAGTFATTHYDVGIRELTKNAGEEDTQPVQYRNVRIWVADTNRMPVRLEADLSIGHLYAKLTGFQAGQAR